ncbi:hypothetical protein V2J09_021361 [Rumex salicifolius]
MLPNFHRSETGTGAEKMLAANGSFQLRACLPQHPPFPLATKLLVRNLPYSARECRLQKEFSSFGTIAEVKLVKDEATKKSKGYAFIQYTSQDDAMLALENMDHKSINLTDVLSQYFDGRMIYVELAKPGKDVYGGIPIPSGPPEETATLYDNVLATQPGQQD